MLGRLLFTLLATSLPHQTLLAISLDASPRAWGKPSGHPGEQLCKSEDHLEGYEADREEKIFKLLFLDVGIMNAILGLNWSDITASPDLKLVNEGALAEQFVGQHLLDVQLQSQLSGLNYWLREGKGDNSEVDYVCAIDGRILPIEVKAGASGSLRSLHQFMGEKKLKLAVRLDLNPPSIQKIETKIQTKKGTEEVRYSLLSLPLYLVEKIPEIVRAVSELYKGEA